MRRTIIGIFAGLIIGVSLTAGTSLVRAATGDTSVASFLPDMEQVFNNALSSMFSAADAKFTDPELKAYYDQLTQSILNREPYTPPYDASVTLNDGTVVK